MMKTNKTFDSITFKRKAQLAIYEEIKDMSREEQLLYFHRRAEIGPLGKWWMREKETVTNDKPPSYCCAEKMADYKGKR
jgi:hypothetical protein